jgi:hypothetical protein
MIGYGEIRKRRVNLWPMQTRLALADSSRRHPFRSQMRRIAIEERRAREDSDIKLFFLSFTAFFVCFYTFIL